MNSALVLEERMGTSAIFRLCRPEVLNAYNAEMVEQLRALLRQAGSDPSVAAVVLTGSGRAFCTGLDLKSAQLDSDGKEFGLALRNRMERLLNPLVAQLVDFSKPVVVAVNGVAAGGGVGLALSGDVVLAAQSATFVLPSAPRLGLLPDTGASWHLVRDLGRARALGLTLLGDPLPAQNAEQWGLIWRCVEDDVLLQQAVEVAGRLAGLSSATLRHARQLLDGANVMDLDEQLRREARANEYLAAQPEFRAGVQQFRKRRADRMDSE